MAAIQSHIEKSISQNYTESDVKQKLSCNNCIEYQHKLEELILELSSAKKIIQLLEEDQNTCSGPTTTRAPDKGQNSHVSNELHNTWETVSDK